MPKASTSSLRSKALPFFTSALLEKLLAQRFQRGENDLIRELEQLHTTFSQRQDVIIQ